MFQSNKEYFEFLKQSGVHSFLQETPNNLLTDKHIQTKSTENKDLKSLNEITEIKNKSNFNLSSGYCFMRKTRSGSTSCIL